MFRRSSTNKINPASDSEYSDRAVWILCGCDCTDLEKKKQKRQCLALVLSFTCTCKAPNKKNSLTKVKVLLWSYFYPLNFLMYQREFHKRLKILIPICEINIWSQAYLPVKISWSICPTKFYLSNIFFSLFFFLFFVFVFGFFLFSKEVCIVCQYINGYWTILEMEGTIINQV